MVTLKPGDVFVADVPSISQETINAFGAILGTNGPIHTDPEFAKKTPLKGVVVQGMLVLAPLHELMCRLFGAETWLRTGRVDTKIVSYTRPGDATRFEIKIEEVDERGARLSFACVKDTATTVVVGSASVSFDDRAKVRTDPDAERQASVKNVNKMFEARSVAVLGASEKFAKPGGRALIYLEKYGYRGKVFPINPKHTTLLGRRCFPDVRSLPETPDVVVVAVPAKDVPAAIAECAEAGIPSAIIYTSGFAEVGPAGAALEREVRAVVAKSGMAVCGPNCQGVGNLFTGLALNFSSCFSDTKVAAGPVGIVSESGLFGGLIVAACSSRGIGVGYSVSTGNEAGMQFADAVEFMADDPRIRVIAGYLEGIRDMDRFRRAAERARSNGKALVILKVGETAESARVAASHTGSVTGSPELYRAAFAEMGVITVESLEDLIDTAVTFAQTKQLPRGPSVGILTNSGGLGVFCTDEVSRQGLALAAFAPETVARIQARLPEFGAPQNPVDITLQAYTDVDSVAAHIENICQDESVDIVVLCFGIQKLNVPELTAHLARISSQSDRPILVSWIDSDPAPKRALGVAGVPVYSDPARALKAARQLVERQACGSRRARERGASRHTGLQLDGRALN